MDDLERQANEIPPPIAKALDEIVAAARHALEPDLLSVVLFGSAAEGRMRPTSDVNRLNRSSSSPASKGEGRSPARAAALRVPRTVLERAGPGEPSPCLPCE